MLRDEFARLVGAARGEAVLWQPGEVAAPLRDIERTWIRVCQDPLGLWPASAGLEPQSQEHQLMSGLERICEAGTIGTSHLAVLLVNGRLGRPPNMNYTAAYDLWTDAMKALDAELRSRPARAS